ncbi:hypothetical protein OY671_009445, partial [Metschnikowia pulcherrima]
AIQSRGTAVVALSFGPVMSVYFAVSAVMGVANIAQAPEVSGAVNPIHASRFFSIDPGLAFLALGSVVSAVTGAEALYADMGHFGRKAIMVAWSWVAFPCSLINYSGQSASSSKNPAMVENPFFSMAPDWARSPSVISATSATIIASQAVISGAFSISQQAVQSGFSPRIRIRHTSASAAGQIYVPSVNWSSSASVISSVSGFRTSSNLA